MEARGINSNTGTPTNTRTLVELLRSTSPWLSNTTTGADCGSAWVSLHQPEWPTLLKLAHWHGVDGLLYESAKRSDAWSHLPDYVRTQLRDGYTRNRVSGWQYRQELIALQKSFTDQQIPVIVFKGPALVDALYGDSGLRLYGDLDLLIHESDLIKAVDLLHVRGYVQVRTMIDATEINEPQLNTEITLARSGDRPPVIDLHWEVMSLPFYRSKLRVGWFWEHSVEFKVGEYAARTFSPEAYLLLLSAHHAKHKYERLIWSHDLALAVRKWGDSLNWREIANVAGPFGLIIPLQKALAQIRNEWGIWLPDEAVSSISSLRPAATERIAYFFTTAETPYLKVIWFALTLSGIREKMRYIAKVLFPSEAYMRNKYGLSSRRQLMTYYVRRLAGGVKKLFSGAKMASF